MKKTDNDQEKQNAMMRIMENYLYMNTMMINQMELMSVHSGLTGDFREKLWLDFFRLIIPQKYSLAQGVIIIDSEGNQSKEVDIAVFDEQYTPYVFRYNSLKFIPIEAVSIVISCKSKEWNKGELQDWSESFNHLCTRRAGVTRTIHGLTTGYTNPSQTRTRPIKILAAMKLYKNAKSFKDMCLELQNHFDFIILEQEKNNNKQSNGNNYKIFDFETSHKERTLGDWYRELNHVGCESSHLDNKYDVSIKESNWKSAKAQVDKDNLLQFIEQEKNKDNMHLKFQNTLKDLEVPGNPLLTLNLQLNQLLMLINNPMLFPHYAYAKKFQSLAKEMNNCD